MKKNFIKLASLLILSQLACGGVEFRDASFEPVKGYSEMTYEAGSEEKKVFVASNVLLDSTAIEDAYVAPSGTSTDHHGNTETLYGVAIVFTDEGAEKMQEITEARISKPLAIIIDGEVLSVPVVQAKIGKRSTITGPGSESEAGLILHKIIESFDADRQNTAHVLAMRASLAMKSGNPEAALEFLEKAINKEPNVADYWVELGMAQDALNERDQASNSYSKALKLLRSDTEKRPIDQIMLLLLMGREKDAKESFSLYAPELKKTHPEIEFDDLLEIYNAQFRNE